MKNLSLSWARVWARARARGYFYIVGPLALAFCVSPVMAQSVPSSVDPGRLQRNLDAPPKADQISPSPKTPALRAPKNFTPQDAEKLTFVLGRLSVEGVTAYDPNALIAFAKGRIGKTITVAELFDIAAKMTARYRNDGYLLSRVIVPPQKIDSGSVTLKAIEGYVDKIKVEGLSGKRAQVIRGYVGKIVGQKPLRRGVLERYLLLANDLPGMIVRSFIEPSSQSAGAATLTLKVNHKSVDAWSRINNRGTKYVGPYQAEIGGSLNGIASADQSLTVRAISTPLEHEEMKYANLQFAQQLNKEGMSIVISAHGLQSEPGSNLAPLELESYSYGVNVGFNFKPLRSREHNLYLSVSASFDNAKTDALGAVLSEDNSRTLRVGGEYQFIDSFAGSSSAAIGASRGFTVMGATPKGDILQTRADAIPNATWFDARVSRLQSLGAHLPGVSVQAAIAGQYSLDAHSSSREFGVGGLANASAFDSSEINGDHGVSGRVEVRYSTALPKVDDAVLAGSLLDTGVQFYGFADGGAVWQEDAQFTQQRKDRIASAGIGLRFNVGAHVSGNVEVGKPFIQDVTSTGNREPRVFFQLIGRF